MEPLKGIQESVIKEERDYLESKKITILFKWC